MRLLNALPLVIAFAFVAFCLPERMIVILLISTLTSGTVILISLFARARGRR